MTTVTRSINNTLTGFPGIVHDSTFENSGFPLMLSRQQEQLTMKFSQHHTSLKHSVIVNQLKDADLIPSKTSRMVTSHNIDKQNEFASRQFEGQSGFNESDKIELELKPHHKMELARHHEELRLREQELQRCNCSIQEQVTPSRTTFNVGSSESVGRSCEEINAKGQSEYNSRNNGKTIDNISALESATLFHNGVNNGIGFGAGIGLDRITGNIDISPTECTRSVEALTRRVLQAANLSGGNQFSTSIPTHFHPHNPVLSSPCNGFHFDPFRSPALLQSYGPFSFMPTVNNGRQYCGTSGHRATLVDNENSIDDHCDHTPSSDKISSRPASVEDRPPSNSCSSPGAQSVDTRSAHWTFEEQFKQLYELTDEQQRKDFLDDLFAFMQRRGSPVNRIPIMAKQTLDLYELFRLVVSKGGLVEVINKKLWREVTKGLNLPSSITSAAFTLRTQYMKYLYPYECEKLKLSIPGELQVAIDGNRREGRRSSYGYELSPVPSLVPSTNQLNGGIDRWTNGLCAADFWGRPQGMETWRPVSPVLDLSNKAVVSAAAAWANQAVVSTSRAYSTSGFTNNFCHLDDKTDNPSVLYNQEDRCLAERDALAIRAASNVMDEEIRKGERRRCPSEQQSIKSNESCNTSPTMKRPMADDESSMAGVGSLPSAHFKISSREDGETQDDGSLLVTMDINGVLYQGVLYAPDHPSRTPQHVNDTEDCRQCNEGLG